MTHHHTKFAYKRLSSSENIFWAKTDRQGDSSTPLWQSWECECVCVCVGGGGGGGGGVSIINAAQVNCTWDQLTCFLSYWHTAISASQSGVRQRSPFAAIFTAWCKLHHKKITRLWQQGGCRNSAAPFQNNTILKVPKKEICWNESL